MSYVTTLQVVEPALSLSDFNISGLIETVKNLALQSLVPIQGLPSLPSLASLLNVDVTKLTSTITQIQQASTAVMASSGTGTWMQLLSSLGSAVSAVVPQLG